MSSPANIYSRSAPRAVLRALFTEVRGREILRSSHLPLGDGIMLIEGRGMGPLRYAPGEYSVRSLAFGGSKRTPQCEYARSEGIAPWEGEGSARRVGAQGRPGRSC